MSPDPLTDLVEALRNTQHSVFRFEGRQTYADDQAWLAHLRGEDWATSPDIDAYREMVEAAWQRGATWTRVRAVVEPWTPYTAWEIEQHYPTVNLPAGEDVRLLAVSRREHDARPSDFWLVDDQAWQLDYDARGVMRPVPATGPALVAGLREWRADLLARAVPLVPAIAP